LEEISTSKRIVFIDWLRFIVVFLLIPFHAAISYTGGGNVFVYDEHIRTSIENGTLTWNAGPAFMRYFTMFLDNWFMHLLFLLAGITTALALCKRTPLEYVQERFCRLLWPYTIGILTVIPAQSWLRALCFGRFNGNFFAFYPHFFNGINQGPTSVGNFEWGHFWFLIYLFVFSMISLPLFMKIIQKGKGSIIYKTAMAISNGERVLLFAVWFSILEAAFRPGWPGFQNLINDWANFSVYLSYFILGFIVGRFTSVLESIERNRHKAFFLGFSAFLCRIIIYRICTVQDGYTIANIVVQGFRGAASYGFVLAAIGYGKRLLNNESKYMNLIRDLSFPLYFLHFFFVSAVTYLLIGTGLSTWFRWFITIISTSCIILLFTLPARHIYLFRNFFGLNKVQN
jgi:glucans biosynthesis protein C